MVKGRFVHILGLSNLNSGEMAHRLSKSEFVLEIPIATPPSYTDLDIWKSTAPIYSNV